MGTATKISGLLNGLRTRQEEQIWDEFLKDFASLILQVVHLFERDQDRIDDCFVFVCEQLKRDDLRRLRRFDEHGAASFTTWLRTVVRNLCLDWRRKRLGRPRPFRAIERLASPDVEVYRAIHLRGLTESEALEAVRLSFPEFSHADLAASLARIADALTPHQAWLVASRHLRQVSLSTSFGAREAGTELDPAAREPNPEQRVALDEQLDLLRDGLEELAPEERLLLRLRYEQELTLEEVGRLTGVGSASTAQRAIERTLEKLRLPLGAGAERSVSVKRE